VNLFDFKKQKMETKPLTEGNYFHIYNRGINGENIFKEEANYYYFLQQYKKYCADVFETYSYALLKNHFHLFVYVKEKVIVKRNDGNGEIILNASKQLSHFFNSYAQAINKSFERTGALFESPFKRKIVDNDNYFTSMIYYCHYNAQLHQMVDDNFKDWPFSSYHSIIDNDNNIVVVDKVLKWFGGKEAFIKQHEERYENRKFINFEIEN
jgi:putative transposase